MSRFSPLYKRSKEGNDTGNATTISSTSGSPTDGPYSARFHRSGNLAPRDSVEAYDAAPYETSLGYAKIDDYNLWSGLAAQFIRSASGLDPSAMWVGRKPLGEGSFGLAGLWERVDTEGTVVDQLVIKQIGRGRKGTRKWKPEMPHEVAIMKELNKTGCSGVVQIKGYKRYLHEEVHRIYMEYCPYGDLRRLCKRYRRFRRHLPEPFLWEVFYRLVEACSAMAKGPDDAKQRDLGVPPWDFEIVHRDIKPGNVFLGYESSEAQHYPTAKLGDFGLSVETNFLDAKNPRKLTGAGTFQYMAPEQHRHLELPDSLINTDGHLSWYTNIWAVGAIVFELLTLHRVYPYVYNHRFVNDGEGIPEIHTSRDPEYSPELRTLIQQCLRPDPHARPSCQELLYQISTARQILHNYGLTIRGDDKSNPHPDERVYYRGNEISTMQPGNWQPSRGPPAAKVPNNNAESGFADQSISPVHFPEWTPRAPSESDYSPEINPQRDGRGAGVLAPKTPLKPIPRPAAPAGLAPQQPRPHVLAALGGGLPDTFEPVMHPLRPAWLGAEEMDNENENKSENEDEMDLDLDLDGDYEDDGEADEADDEDDEYDD